MKKLTSIFLILLLVLVSSCTTQTPSAASLGYSEIPAPSSTAEQERQDYLSSLTIDSAPVDFSNPSEIDFSKAHTTNFDYSLDYLTMPHNELWYVLRIVVPYFSSSIDWTFPNPRDEYTASIYCYVLNRIIHGETAHNPEDYCVDGYYYDIPRAVVETTAAQYFTLSDSDLSALTSLNSDFIPSSGNAIPVYYYYAEKDVIVCSADSLAVSGGIGRYLIEEVSLTDTDMLHITVRYFDNPYNSNGKLLTVSEAMDTLNFCIYFNIQLDGLDFRYVQVGE